MHNTTAPMTVNRYDAIMIQLLEINMHVRNLALNSGHFFEIDKESALLSYCTVAIDAGRQTGKTSWILKQFTAEDLILVTNESMRDALIENLTPEQYQYRHRIYTSVDGLLEGQAGDKPPEYRHVYVDSAFWVFDRFRKRGFYKWLARGLTDPKRQTVYLMG